MKADLLQQSALQRIAGRHAVGVGNQQRRIRPLGLPGQHAFGMGQPLIDPAADLLCRGRAGHIAAQRQPQRPVILLDPLHRIGPGQHQHLRPRLLQLYQCAFGGLGGTHHQHGAGGFYRLGIRLVDAAHLRQRQRFGGVGAVFADAHQQAAVAQVVHHFGGAGRKGDHCRGRFGEGHAAHRHRVFRIVRLLWSGRIVAAGRRQQHQHRGRDGPKFLHRFVPPCFAGLSSIVAALGADFK